jgi:hypothetical protein
VPAAAPGVQVGTRSSLQQRRVCCVCVVCVRTLTLHLLPHSHRLHALPGRPTAASSCWCSSWAGACRPR